MITILIPTYNRLKLLQKAVNSCLFQKSKSFNLLIIDNCSTDGTKEYLENLNFSNINIIYNMDNYGARISTEKALNLVKTKWVTILSDDDYLEDSFIKSSMEVLKTTDKGIVSVGFNTVDVNENIIHTYLYGRQTLDRNDAMTKALNGENIVAGVSGFFFISDKIINNKTHLLFDYPKGFLTDTMLIMKGIIEYDGIEVIDEVLYNRLEWDSSESSFSLDNMKLYFEALLMFGHDLKKVSDEYNFKKEVRTIINRRLPLESFLRIVFLPIFFKTSLSYRDLLDFKTIIINNDKRYILYWFYMLLFFPFMTKYSFYIRNNLYQNLKKIKKYVKKTIS